MKFSSYKLMKLKPFIFEINEIKSGRVQEVGKGGKTKSLNLLHLWLKLVIDKKMGWGKRLNEILLSNCTKHHVAKPHALSYEVFFF